MLDIGTGNGATLPVWLNAGYQVSAMEPDDEGFKLSKMNVSADVRQYGVGEKLPAEWESCFDGATCLEVAWVACADHPLWNIFINN